jgi:hypothetical protein
MPSVSRAEIYPRFTDRELAINLRTRQSTSLHLPNSRDLGHITMLQVTRRSVLRPSSSRGDEEQSKLNRPGSLGENDRSTRHSTSQNDRFTLTFVGQPCWGCQWGTLMSVPLNLFALPEEIILKILEDAADYRAILACKRVRCVTMLVILSVV